MTHNSTVKASVVTVLFAVFGIIGLVTNYFVQSHAILFALLLVHTFFSVRCFSALIDPKDKRQIAVDSLLVISYLGLALSIGTEYYLLWWVVLFIFASLKYVLLIGRLHYPILLRRKLTADIGGIGFGFGMQYMWVFFGFHEDYRFFFEGKWFGILTGFEWIWVGIFAIATTYYFFVRPLYVPDKMSAL